MICYLWECGAKEGIAMVMGLTSDWSSCLPLVACEIRFSKLQITVAPAPSCWLAAQQALLVNGRKVGCENLAFVVDKNRAVTQYCEKVEILFPMNISCISHDEALLQ